MSKLKAIIVDDEESARNVLSRLLQRNCPNVEVVASCVDVPAAVTAIKEYQPDLVFLDVQMPNFAGYEIVNFFDEICFEIIFTTAHDQYAIKAFELSAIDYLLKPINRIRLMDAVDKTTKKVEGDRKIEQLKVLMNSMKEERVEKIVISELGNKRVIDLDSILAIEAQGAYSMIHTREGQVVASKNLRHFERVLIENNNFFRSHKSWIINLNEIKGVQLSKGIIDLDMVSAKLSKYKAEEFKSLLN